MTGEELLFFNESPTSLALYAALKEALLACWPETSLRVQKTQITFCRPKGYAAVSLPRKKADRADGALVLTFSLPEEEQSLRILARAQVSARRWTHHVLLRTVEDVDEQVLAWVEVSDEIAR